MEAEGRPGEDQPGRIQHPPATEEHRQQGQHAERDEAAGIDIEQCDHGHAEAEGSEMVDGCEQAEQSRLQCDLPCAVDGRRENHDEQQNAGQRNESGAQITSPQAPNPDSDEEAG